MDSRCNIKTIVLSMIIRIRPEVLFSSPFACFRGCPFDVDVIAK